MTDLSPNAQAVLDAIDGIERPQWIAEAALRAVADQVFAKNRLAALDTQCSAEARLLLIWARDQILGIAAELEGAN